MKRSPWLYLSLIAIVLGTLFFLTSCSKSALVPQHYESIHQKWIVQEGHDVNTWSHAVFCDSSDYGVIDTVDIYYTVEPDNPNKFSYQPGSIYFPPKGRVETDQPGIYDRKFCQLLEQIN